MQYYIVYSELTGQILRTGQCHDDDIGSQPDYTQSQNVLQSITGIETDVTHYVNLTSTPTITEKTPLFGTITDWTKFIINANGIDSAQLGNGDLPFGLIINIKPPVLDSNVSPLPIPDPLIVTDGSFVFKATFPGNYEITASIFPYADYLASLIAVKV